MSKRKTIAGRGINDSDYATQSKGVTCPMFSAWCRMLRKDVEVSEEWLLFSNFRGWMERQDWEGKQISPYVFGDGSIYSAQTCCFVDRKLAFIVKSLRLGTGKTVDIPHGFSPRPYRAVVSGKHVGYYKTQEEAEIGWKRALLKELKSSARKYIGTRTELGLKEMYVDIAKTLPSISRHKS
jgi:hypothetical protein